MTRPPSIPLQRNLPPLLPLLPLLSALCLSQACAAATPPPATPVPARDPGAQHYAQAAAMVRAGDLIRAEQYLSAAIRAGYPRARVVPQLIRVCVSASRYRAALGHASPALARDPTDFRLRLLVASLHAALSQPGPALNQLARLARSHPQLAPAHHLRARLLQDAGDLGGASQAFTHYLRAAPGGPHAAEAQDWLAAHAAPRPTHLTRLATPHAPGPTHRRRRPATPMPTGPAPDAPPTAPTGPTQESPRS